MKKLFFILFCLLINCSISFAEVVTVKELSLHPYSFLNKKLVYLYGQVIGKNLVPSEISGSSCSDCWILKDETGYLWIDGYEKIKIDKGCFVKILVSIEKAEETFEEWEAHLLQFITVKCPSIEKTEEEEDHGMIDREASDIGMFSKRGRHYFFFEKKRARDYW